MKLLGLNKTCMSLHRVDADKPQGYEIIELYTIKYNLLLVMLHTVELKMKQITSNFNSSSDILSHMRFKIHEKLKEKNMNTGYSWMTIPYEREIKMIEFKSSEMGIDVEYESHL